VTLDRLDAIAIEVILAVLEHVQIQD